MAKATASAAPTPRLKALYLYQYRKELQAELALSNVHQVPRLEKIVVSAQRRQALPPTGTQYHY